MSPLMMLLAFMLPLLTAATQILNETELYTLFPSNHVGDVLNVTQCYCQSSDPLSPDATFGYYYLFDYWNYHSNHTYTISVSCTSSAPHNPNGTEPAECIHHSKKLKKVCKDYTDGSKFCFKFKEDDDIDHSKPSGSKYYFNKQKRGVPDYASGVLPLTNATQNCGFYCSEELGGLLTSQAPNWAIPGIGSVENSIVSYEDLDDMCFNCDA